MDINGKVGLVTGGASGLGAATVELLLESGASKVAVLDMNESSGHQIVQDLGERVLFIKTDVTDDEAVQGAVAQVAQSCGAMHIVVNCAGVGTPTKIYSKKKGLMRFDSFNRVVQINLIGTMNVIRHTAEQMMGNEPTNADGEKGVVINTASVAAFDGQVGQAAYSASKAAVAGMTLPIAREFATYGIRVMTIAPGLFQTPMMAGLPQAAQDALAADVPFPKRLGNAGEYAKLVKSIVENTMFSGETIRLDGAVRLANNA